VHRVGRTARAGGAGAGMLILDPIERPFLQRLQGQTTLTAAPAPARAGEWQAAVSRALADKAIAELKPRTYLAWLGYNKDQTKVTKLDRAALVARANAYATDTLAYVPPQGARGALAHLPPIDGQVIGKMGLKEMRAHFNIVARAQDGARPSRGGGKPAPKRAAVA
jgi:ATP-dependent RNA helicase MSS116